MDELSKLVDLPAPVKAEILARLEEAIGITPERARQFLEESENEDDGETDFVADATGKFKHFLRTSHGWGPAVDVAWGSLEPLVRAVVEAVNNED